MTEHADWRDCTTTRPAELQTTTMEVAINVTSKQNVVEERHGLTNATNYFVPSRWGWWWPRDPCRSRWTPTGCLPSCTPPVRGRTCDGWRTAGDARWCSWYTAARTCCTEIQHHRRPLYNICNESVRLSVDRQVTQWSQVVKSVNYWTTADAKTYWLLILTLLRNFGNFKFFSGY